MNSVEQIIKVIRNSSNPENIAGQARFGIKGVESYGMSKPEMKLLAKQTGKNHALALELWKTDIHEARHIAAMIAEPKKVTEAMMDKWVKDFNSWDIVDDCCSVLFCRTPFAYDKAIEWTARKKEFEKRAAFALMAFLAVHDKKAEDKKLEQFFPYLLAASDDGRNFVKKAVNWALRQIGKRNPRLCREVIALAKEMKTKDDASSRWIASGVLSELEKYLREGKIKNIGAK